MITTINADLGYTLAAAAIVAVGALASWRCLRADRQQRPKPTPLRQRQLQREASESEPITWRR